MTIETSLRHLAGELQPTLIDAVSDGAATMRARGYVTKTWDSIGVGFADAAGQDVFPEHFYGQPIDATSLREAMTGMGATSSAVDLVVHADGV